jgi:predicted phosphohydrolase
MILAGDTGKGTHAIQYAQDTYGDSADHIVIIAGNHEYYGGTYQKVLAEMRAYAEQFPHLHFLENNTVELNGLNIVGATAWTDYSYGGSGQPLNLYRAADLMHDYQRITWKDRASGYRKIKSLDLLGINRESKRFIFSELQRLAGKVNVVVTHHAPTPLSIHEKYQRDESNFCFVNQWGNDIAYSSAAYWLHGHTHTSSDYQVGDCRVIANPIGYPGENQDSMPIIIEV